MKNLYLSLFFLSMSSFLVAQIAVTLQVDMSNETVSADGVHVAGSFQGWDPAATPMTDDDMDNVYEVVLDLAAGMHEFKFINGAGWDYAEDVPPTCQVEVLGNDNRFLILSETDTEASVHVCFASCAACGMSAVRFRVDMNLESAVSPNGVHVAGNFQGWDPATTSLTDDNDDGIWEAIVPLDTAGLEGILNFKFVNGNAWTNPNENITDEACSDGFGNRVLTISDQNMVLFGDVATGGAPCYNACGTCSTPTEVTFRVDMTTQETVSVNGVHVAGSFQGWSANATPLNDDDGDGIWEVTLGIAASDIQFKFINGNDWSGNGDGNVDNELIVGDCAAEGSDNRALTVGEEAIVYEVCYNSCESGCVENPDPSGCTDPLACNFDPSAIEDDGSCTYPGCMDPLASNYDSSAGCSAECIYVGCTDPLACNYNPSATSDDGSCDYFPCVNCNDAIDIFISEYCEGTGNNKGVEFYNPTSETIDLSNYQLQRYSNGSEAATDWVDLIGSIPPQGTHVLINGQIEDLDLGGGAISPACDPAMQALADQLDNPYPAPVYFNGDDALVLVKNGDTVVDIFGKVGEDPGMAWTDDEANGFIDVGDGATWLTINRTLRRKPDVISGVIENPIVFNTLAEYDVFEVNDWSGLGWHNLYCEDGAAGCTNEMACNFSSIATEDDGSCTYPGCQDPSASNYDEEAGCSAECIYLTYDCTSIGQSGWEDESIGLYPEWQDAMHGVFWEGEWVFNIPSIIEEPSSGVEYAVHHIDWTAVNGLPDWVDEAEFVLGELGEGSQHCIQAAGTPTAPSMYDISAVGEVFISIFGQPFSIGIQTYTAVLEVVGNPNPIPGCMYSMASNYISYATEDDGSCLFTGCMDPQAANYTPLANIDDGSCTEDCAPDADSSCTSDNNGDGVVNVSDLLILLGEFGLDCE